MLSASVYHTFFFLHWYTEVTFLQATCFFVGTRFNGAESPCFFPSTTYGSSRKQGSIVWQNSDRCVFWSKAKYTYHIWHTACAHRLTRTDGLYRKISTESGICQMCLQCIDSICARHGQITWDVSVPCQAIRRTTTVVTPPQL